MVKKVIYSYLLILLASCTSELPTTPDQTGQEQGVPVSFTYSVEPSTDRFSRAVIELPYLTDGETVGIFALTGQMDGNDNFTLTENIEEGNTWHADNIQNNFWNACYIAQTTEYDKSTIYGLQAQNGGNGSFPSIENAALRFYAYHPYSSEVEYTGYGVSGGDPAAPQIPVYIHENIEDTPDYLYTGPIDAKATDTSVNLEFKHALARLNIYLKTTNSDIEGRDYSLSITNITIDAYASQEGTMNIVTGDITSGSARYFNFSKDLENKIIDYYTVPELVYSNLFIPRIYNDDYLFFLNYIEVSLVIIDYNNNIERSEKYKFTRSQLGSIILEKGKVTNIYIDYNRDLEN